MSYSRQTSSRRDFDLCIRQSSAFPVFVYQILTGRSLVYLTHLLVLLSLSFFGSVVISTDDTVERYMFFRFALTAESVDNGEVKAVHSGVDIVVRSVYTRNEKKTIESEREGP